MQCSLRYALIFDELNDDFCTKMMVEGGQPIPPVPLFQTLSMLLLLGWSASQRLVEHFHAVVTSGIQRKDGVSLREHTMATTGTSHYGPEVARVQM